MNKSTSALRHSATVGFWWTLHAYMAAFLLQFVLVDFNSKVPGLSRYAPAEMTEVLRYIKIPLHPLVAFPLFFLAIAASTHLLNLSVHRAIRRTGVADLYSVASDSFKWTARQLTQPHWLVMTMGVSALLVAMVNEANSLKWALVSVLVLIYITPPLILRPRWLNSHPVDRSWIPSAASTGLYLVQSLAFFFIPASTNWAANLGRVLLDFLTFWLVAGVLISTQHWWEIRNLLTSRFNCRFLSLVLVASTHAIAGLALWFLPPILFAGCYGLLIAPGVAQLAPYLPAPVVVTLSTYDFIFYRTLSSVLHWGVALSPFAVVASCLYIGRCLVAFDHPTR